MIVLPSSELKNKYAEVTDAYLDSGEPIFLTKNGYGHAVLISIAEYERLIKDDLTAKIEKGVKEIAEGKGLSVDEAIETVKKELDL